MVVLLRRHVVLQHMKPEFAKAYLREFARILKPNGVLVFQLPSEPSFTWKGALLRLLNTPCARS